MTIKFLSLPALQLPGQIVSDLSNPLLTQQPIQYSMDAKRFAKKLVETCINNRCSPWAFMKHYGIFFQRIGSLYTVPVPEELINQVFQEWEFLKRMPEQPVLRLQVIYGGQQIPLHIDLTKSVSLVYPVLNHDTAITNFYEALTPTPRAIVNPDYCQYVESIKIHKYPALLNIDKPHDVTYPKNSITQQHPRVSLSLKWEQMTFDEILPFVKSYSQSSMV